MKATLTSNGRAQTPLGQCADVERHSHQPTEQWVNDAINEQIAGIERQPCTVGFDDSFFVADIEQICRQHARWVSHLPHVTPFYAVKCNTDVMLLRVLIHLGTGFDCASVEEMRTVLSLGVSPDRIVFANPCKTPWSIDFARKFGIKKTTFDNLDELETIKAHMPDAQLMLRIYANDDGALVKFGSKFGALLDSTKGLLVRAKELDLNVVGVSFHIGTGATNPNAYRKAIADARIVWGTAQSLGFSPQFLDIGGGFYPSEEAFRPMATAISEAIHEAAFPEETAFIGEPGRFFARDVFTLVCRIISRRSSNAASSDKPEMLYQNDGIYRNFMNHVMENEGYAPKLIKSRHNDGQSRKTGNFDYIIWGPTCDGLDCVTREAHFDCEVKVNDWLVYHNMGAYTSATSTQFNGFPGHTRTIYIRSPQEDIGRTEDKTQK